MMTPRLQSLIETFEAIPHPDWVTIVLTSCLKRLGTGGPTAWECVEVFEAWVDNGALFIVYTSPWEPTVGLMRGAEDPDCEDPVEQGQNIADFDVAEPLGTYIDRLTFDANGLGWWGDPLVGTVLENGPRGL
ncbi:hypothetical protein ACTXOR_15385 [Arthrobacter rhombi]|uniref:hypothetical protein n=1 Tax=Arthrobacter rhombi TaxID=71253 RepID=UPI003FCFEA95